MGWRASACHRKKLVCQQTKRDTAVCLGLLMCPISKGVGLLQAATQVHCKSALPMFSVWRGFKCFTVSFGHGLPRRSCLLANKHQTAINQRSVLRARHGYSFHLLVQSCPVRCWPGGTVKFLYVCVAAGYNWHVVRCAARYSRWLFRRGQSRQGPRARGRGTGLHMAIAGWGTPGCSGTAPLRVLHVLLRLVLSPGVCAHNSIGIACPRARSHLQLVCLRPSQHVH